VAKSRPRKRKKAKSVAQIFAISGFGVRFQEPRYASFSYIKYFYEIILKTPTET
jgi:hypothetical protein